MTKQTAVCLASVCLGLYLVCILPFIIANFGSKPEENFKIMRERFPDQPLMCGEYWNGWYERWGEAAHWREPDEVLRDFKAFVDNDWSINIYMFHGGTNFGFNAGAIHFGKYTPIVTSYDYGAFLTESGDRTEAYYRIRDILIEKYGDKVPPLTAKDSEVDKIKILMAKDGLEITHRPVIEAAVAHAEQTGGPAVALQLQDGRIVKGKTSQILGACSAMLLNALKTLANIPQETKLISPAILEPVSALKIERLGNQNPRLHPDEVLIALSICAVTDETARRAFECLSQLRNCEAHASVILAQNDTNTLKKLGIQITCEPRYQTKKLYHG